MQELEDNFKKSGGTFKKFKIGDLFNRINLSRKKNFNKEKDITTEKDRNHTLPLVNAKHGNNGIMYYGNENEWGSTEMSIDIVADGAIATGDVYPQPQKTGILYNAYLIKYKKEISKEGLFYLSTAIFKAIKPYYGYDKKATWDKVREQSILLPIINTDLAFEYMQDYVRELEQDYVRELDAYLKATGLDNYELTEEEKKVLNKNVIFKDYLVGNVFKKLNLKYINKKPFKKSDDLSTEKTDEFNLPLVNAKHGDNGIMYYGRSQDWQSEEYSIDIVNDGAIATGDVYPQPQRTSVLYNAYLIKPTIHTTEFKNESVLLYISKCLEKAIKHKYGYDKKAGWEKVKEDSFKLPETDENSIDFSYMQTYIRAIEKLVIKDLVDWKNQVIKTTKEYVNNNS